MNPLFEKALQFCDDLQMIDDHPFRITFEYNLLHNSSSESQEEKCKFKSKADIFITKLENSNFSAFENMRAGLIIKMLSLFHPHDDPPVFKDITKKFLTCESLSYDDPQCLHDVYQKTIFWATKNKYYQEVIDLVNHCFQVGMIQMPDRDILFSVFKF